MTLSAESLTRLAGETGFRLAALFSRKAARDRFDAHHLPTGSRTDPSRLRAAFILYGAMNRRDWRTIALDDIEVDYRDERGAARTGRDSQPREVSGGPDFRS